MIFRCTTLPFIGLWQYCRKHNPLHLVTCGWIISLLFFFSLFSFSFHFSTSSFLFIVYIFYILLLIYIFIYIYITTFIYTYFLLYLLSLNTILRKIIMRLESKFKISRLLKYAVVAYIMISLFYTTNHYFTAHRSGSVHSRQEEVVNHLEALQEEQPHLPPPKQQQPVIQQDEEEKAVYTQKEKVIIDQLYKDSVTWPSLKGTYRNHIVYINTPLISKRYISKWQTLFLGTPHTLSENLLKSKLFSSSMGYDNITPYYFKASAINKKEDITLATLVTRNRFQVLSRLATNYKGWFFFY